MLRLPPYSNPSDSKENNVGPHDIACVLNLYRNGKPISKDDVRLRLSSEYPLAPEISHALWYYNLLAVKKIDNVWHYYITEKGKKTIETYFENLMVNTF